MKKIPAFFLCFLLMCSVVNAQTFFSASEKNKGNFRNLQRDFNAWKKNRTLSQERYWKHFKRWELETQFHCDGSGEPGNPSDYLSACILNAQQKDFFSLSKTNSGNWFPAGPSALPANLTGYMTNGMGRVNCMAFDPSAATTFYVGVAQGGLWKTTNNGQSFLPLTDNLPITRISDICIDPQNTNTLYVSVCDFEYIGFGLFLNGRKRNTHYGVGVYKSTDGGLSWNATGLTFQLTDGDASLIRKVVVDPLNSNKLVACGVSGMYRSLDGGTSWNKVLDSLFWDLQQDPVSPNTLYAASGWVKNSNTGSAAIYKSTDFGLTWTMLNTGIPFQGTVQRVRLAISPTDNTCIYAIATDIQNGMYGIYKSTDAGVTWSLQYTTLNLLEYGDGNGSGGQGTYDLAILVDPTDKDVVYVGGINLWKSIDGATTFEPCGHWTTNYGPSIHADIHDICFQPLTGYFYAATDGGIWRSSSIVSQPWSAANSGNPWPTQWTQLNDGIQSTSFYRLSSSKSASAELVAGAQDNATFYFDGNAWSTVNGGDGMDNVMDTALTGSFICSSQYGNFAATIDGGQSFFYIGPNVNGENGEWTTPIIPSQQQQGVLYAGFGNVTKSTDGGNSWISISNFPFDPLYQNEISALAVGKSNPDAIVAARRVRYEYGINGSVWLTQNGGATWMDITAGLPDSLYFTGVEISENNASVIFVSMAGFSSGNKIFQSLNGGITWSNISFNLPNIPVNCIKQIPGTNHLMIASDIGVWILFSGTNTWVNQSVGLPNVIVSDIEFNQALNKVYVSTFGRGIWAADLDVLAGQNELEIENPRFNLYPSINEGRFTISLDEKNKNFGAVVISIVDVKGQKVMEENFYSKDKIELNISLNSGLYFAVIRSGAYSEVKKFIVR
jgi:photosystem II stability/assembly factor-like uncharacterized protein